MPRQKSGRESDAPIRPLTGDITPPHDGEAERAVLGAMMVGMEKAVAAVVEILRDNQSDTFYFPQHQIIYNAIVSLFRRNQPTDVVLVRNELDRAGNLEKVGGAAYLADLINAMPSSEHAEYYARIVLQKAMQRRLITVCDRTRSLAYQGQDDVDGLLEAAEREIFSLNQQRHVNPVYWVGDLVDDAEERFRRLRENQSGVTGVPSGFLPLDRLLSGFQPSDMVVLAARPSVGKTALALNISLNVAQEIPSQSVLIFSLEMAKEQLVNRLVCLAGGVDMGRLRNGFFSAQELEKVQDAIEKIRSLPIYIDETAGMTPLEMRSKARRHAAQHEISLIVIDYLQLMHVGRQVENRQAEIAEISRFIKSMARELHVPVLTLSQLSREADKDERGEPKLVHLRESGAIEQDADVVLILFRPNAQHSDQLCLKVAKHRNGPTGKLNLLFRPGIQQFVAVDDRDPAVKAGVPANAAYDDAYEFGGGGYAEDDDMPPFTDGDL
ncbi:MAG TPA: replicative DNA helicase [Candidatus Hydrogenedentes bacterium]|nr:replicative DNA helicase [Candidatus Hydrogenedentota bacterium]HPU97645.1 replicative DNA helicase [Candidatus Hydrogenedentota bacterium]